MRVKVVKEFIDKHSRKLHKVNEVFECNNDRFKEIESTGHYVVETKNEPAKTEGQK